MNTQIRFEILLLVVLFILPCFSGINKKEKLNNIKIQS